MLAYLLGRWELLVVDDVGQVHFTNARFWRRASAERRARELNEDYPPDAPLARVYDRWAGGWPTRARA